MDRGNMRVSLPGRFPLLQPFDGFRDFIENRKAAQAFKARLQQNERDADNGRFFGGGGPSRHDNDHGELSAKEVVKAKRDRERELELAEKEKQVFFFETSFAPFPQLLMLVAPSLRGDSTGEGSNGRTAQASTSRWCIWERRSW